MSKAKDKGRRHENEIANFLTDNNIPSERIPLSGSFGGRYNCDVVIGTPEQPKATIECKYRENISKQLWEWMEGNDFLTVRRNNHKALIMMNLDTFVKLYHGVWNNEPNKQQTNK